MGRAALFPTSKGPSRESVRWEGQNEELGVTFSFGNTEFSVVFCLPPTELGNTISSLFGGGGPEPEAGENLTDPVQVSRGVAAGSREAVLALAGDAGVALSGIGGVWQLDRVLSVSRKCFSPRSFTLTRSWPQSLCGLFSFVHFLQRIFCPVKHLHAVPVLNPLLWFPLCLPW